MNDPAIPPMPELAAWILKHEIKKYPSFSETEVAKRARSRILNRRGGKGKFLTENAKYWIARMQGGGGVGKNSVLPIGHTTMDKSLSWREGFRVEGDPVIIEERDYPGLDLQEIADLFTAQAIVLYRTETRGSNIGPDISNLADPEPLTAINMEGETNFDLLLTQRKQREAYANTVLRSLHYAVPRTMGINFNSTRGRIHGLHPLMFNPGTENVGIALPIPQPNEVSNLVCIEILGTAITSTRVLLERGEILAEALEEELSAKTMLCSKGKTGYIYIAGGTMGGLSYNDVYDRLATMGKLVGNPASNSKVSYKDIEFKDLGIKVSRESFTRRNEDVLQLPLSLDIYPSKEKESMSKAYEGSHRLGAAFNQTGLAITPVANPMVFDPGYDDHPQIVQYRMNEMAPAVIEFLRQARVAIPESEVEPELVLPSNTWQQMRTENAKVKEATQEDLQRVNDAFCIPKGREVSLVFDGTRTVMQVNNELAFTGIPQTNDFNQYCVAAGIESISVKGILTPSDGTNHTLLDRVVEMDVIPSDLGESLNTFMPLEVQVYGVLDDSPLSRIRGLGFPRAKFVRNISTESEGSNFAELVTDELDSGYATRILLDFSDEESKNMYSEQVLDAAVIGFDLEGKNPQNGMIGKVIVALLSTEKIRVDKGGKPKTIKAEMYNPIGVVGAFAGFDVDAKRRIFEHLSNNATHPGYGDGYLMVNPEKANLVVRIMHKGVLSVKRQPRFRLVTKMKDFVGPTIPVERSPLDSTLGRGVPTDMNLQRLQFGGRPEKIPGNANLEPFDEVELPIMRSPTITSIVTEVDGFEEHFIEKDDTYSSRYSEQSERLTFKAPLTQLPFNNPLRGAEPILDDAYEGPVDVQTLLTASLNPPTENWSAHRQRVPWDFAPNAFGRGSAFRTFKMDDPTSRRKAIHMDGWNRRYDKYKGVQAIAGRLLNGKWHIQSIRVPRKYKLRRTLKEVRLDRKRPPKWYKELHPEAKPFGTKKNPIVPRNYLKAMDEGWTGFPTWAIQPTFSISDLQGNPPKKTPGGKTIPKRYLKGLTKEEMEIAIKEIDKGYKYDIDDPEAYEYWKSDIKATARGYKTVPSKYKKKFIKMYGPLPEKGKFIDKIAKATKIKKRILQKVYDKGLAAWRVGHRPGVQQHQWAAGRVYSFVTLGNTVVKGKKKMSDYTLAVEAGIIKDGELIKKNPVVHEENVPVFHEYEENWLAENWDIDRREHWRTGLFVGALLHEEHIGKLASNKLDLVILVDPSFSNEPWREEIFRQYAPYAEIEIHAVPLSKYLGGEFNESFSLVHYPHRASAGDETTDVNEVDPATSVGFDLLQKIRSQSHDKTFFINIRPEHLPGISDERFLNYQRKSYEPYSLPKLEYTDQQLEEFSSKPDGIDLDDLLDNPLKVITSNIITISGRSGSGKSTIAKGIKKRLGRDARIVPSYMTRKKRTNEKEPEDGVFITKKKFKEMIKRGEFTSSNGTDLWVEQESGHFYGRRAADFEKSGVAIVDVSFPGLKLMREAFGDKVYAVLIKSRMGDDRNREILRRRGVHTEEEIERRVKIGSYMMKDENWKPLNFDFVASNRRGELDKNVAMISAEFRKSMNRPACPLATQDLEVNTKNRDHAIAAEHIQYGPLNLNDEEYWERYAKKWNTTADVAKKSNCSNCIAFDISPRMKKCMPGETSDPEGELGYCWMHHFKCHSARTCNTWAAGGPIDLDKVSFDWQERNAQVKKNPPAVGVDWNVKYTPFEEIKAGARGLGYVMPNFVVEGIHPDGETKVTMSMTIYEIGKRFRKVTLPNGKERFLKIGIDPEDGSVGYKFSDSALNRYDWIQKQGFSNFAYINGIGLAKADTTMAHFNPPNEDEETEIFGSGKGMGQAAYLHAAKILGQKFGLPLLSTNPSESATRAWDALERNLPSGYEFKRSGLSTAVVKTAMPGRLLWWVGEGSKIIKKNPPIPKVLYHGTSSKVAEIYLREGKNEHRDQGRISEHYGALRPEQAYNYAVGQTAMDMNHIGNWDGDTPKEIYHPVVLQFDVEGLNVIEDSQERNLSYDWNAGREFVIMENIPPNRISVYKRYPPLERHGWEDYEKAKIPQDELAKMMENPPKEPPTLEEFREWVDLVNMKNKELKAFMDSDWFAVSGLTPKQAKEQGIKSGQDSFRAIIRMRKKLGLRGPKDYIKSGPRITKQFYELALKKWTGPDASVPVDDDLTDWGWMKRQLRFNKRASSFPYNQAEEKRKGPLVKKQKTQNKPSRRLLSLWVWGHDPWRWARKHGVERMPKCPDVPWVGMTEKRKYGKVPVLMGPKKNPAYPSKKHGHFPETVLSTFSPVEEENHEKTQKHQKKHDAAVKKEMQKTFPGWTWNQMPLEGKEGAKEAKALRAARKKIDSEIGAFTVCPVDCKFCMIEQSTKRNPRVMKNPENVYTTHFDFEPGRIYSFDELPDTMAVAEMEGVQVFPRTSSTQEDARIHFKRVKFGGYGFPGKAEDAQYRAVLLDPHYTLKKHKHLTENYVTPELLKSIEEDGLMYPSIGNEGNHRKMAMALLGKPIPHLQIISQGKILSNPVIESGIPGVRMAYMKKPGVFGSEYNWDSEIIEASKHEKGLIGETPVASTSRYQYNEEKGGNDWTKVVNVGKVVRMSPNDYFDLLAAGGYEVPERSAKVRWKDLGINHVMSIVDGLKNGQVMIMPTISFDGRSQEGGHRMEALRQMGHADTPVPVMYLHDEEQTVSDANPAEEIFSGPHGALTETEFFRENPPATMMTAFQTDGPRADNNQLYAGGGKVVQAKMKSGDFEKHPTYGTRYKKYPATDPDQKHFSPLPFIARKWKKSTFKSQPETDYTYFKEQLEQDDTPYTVTLKIDGEGTLAHFDGKETVIWNWYDRWRTNFHITDEITKKLKKKGVKSAKIMGELYAVDEKGMMLPMTGGSRDEEGRSETVGSIIKTTGDASTMDRQNRIRWAAFDLLELNGVDMRNEPFEERIDILKELLSTKGTAIVVPHRRGKGLKPFKTAWEKWMRDPEFEGGVLRFDTGKTFKVKGAMTADMAVIGYYYGSSEEREGRGGSFADWAGGLALAFMDENGNYVYSGNVGTGFTHADRQELEESLSKQQVRVGPTITKWNGHLLATDKNFGKHDDTGKGIMYAVQPSMIVEVEYRGLNWGDKPVYKMNSKGEMQQVGVTQAPTLFQPSFKRFRFDKELTPFDLRMSQVAGEGEGKWKKNPVNTSYTLSGRKKIEIPRIVVWPRYHTVADARKNPNHIFLFGDNDRRTGKRGQAVIRGEPNAFGIRTKHKPATSASSYFSDERYEKNVKMMKDDFVKAIEAVSWNGTLVLPRDGLGTGLADLPNKAPQTFAWLQQLSEMLNTFATNPGAEAEVEG